MEPVLANVERDVGLSACLFPDRFERLAGLTKRGVPAGHHSIFGAGSAPAETRCQRPFCRSTVGAGSCSRPARWIRAMLILDSF